MLPLKSARYNPSTFSFSDSSKKSISILLFSLSEHLVTLILYTASVNAKYTKTKRCKIEIQNTYNIYDIFNHIIRFECRLRKYDL